MRLLPPIVRRPSPRAVYMRPLACEIFSATYAALASAPRSSSQSWSGMETVPQPAGCQQQEAAKERGTAARPPGGTPTKLLQLPPLEHRVSERPELVDPLSRGRLAGKVCRSVCLDHQR